MVCPPVYTVQCLDRMSYDYFKSVTEDRTHPSHKNGGRWDQRINKGQPEPMHKKRSQRLAGSIQSTFALTHRDPMKENASVCMCMCVFGAGGWLSPHIILTVK